MNSPEMSLGTLNGLLILLVDDVQDNVEIMQELLEIFGAEVMTAENGLEGLKRAVRRPDLIITDLAMPVMTGYEFLRALKDDRATAQIPVIALTAHAMDSYRIAAFEAGCHNFLVKPVESEALLREIVEVLDDAATLQKLPPV